MASYSKAVGASRESIRHDGAQSARVGERFAKLCRSYRGENHRAVTTRLDGEGCRLLGWETDIRLFLRSGIGR